MRFLKSPVVIKALKRIAGLKDVDVDILCFTADLKCLKQLAALRKHSLAFLRTTETHSDCSRSFSSSLFLEEGSF